MKISYVVRNAPNTIIPRLMAKMVTVSSNRGNVTVTVDLYTPRTRKTKPVAK